MGGTVPYIEDPYDRKKELFRKEIADHKSKMQDKPFSNKVSPRTTFWTDKDQYGLDREMPVQKEKKKMEPLRTHDF